MTQLTGHCACGAIEFELTDTPLFVHCCHCTWCQRETGSAFATNVLIESSCLHLNQGETEATPIPSNSGHGQIIHRCPACKTAVWSHYGGAGEKMSFVRGGTLMSPPDPDIHIFTSTKLPWVVIPEGVVQTSEYYDPRKEWSENAQLRWRQMMGK